MLWFTSDTHYGHTNIINYTARPYRTPDGQPDVHAMNIDLVNRYNTVVTPTDTVWLLGDIALGHLDDTLGWLARCHGTKHLLVGNHDKPFRSINKPDKHANDTAVYMTHADLATVTTGHRSLTLSDGHTVTICHFPHRGDSHDTDRFTSHRPPNDGWLLCGHVHEKWRQHGTQINVGVDAWGGYPVNEQSISALINAGPAERGPLPWT